MNRFCVLLTLLICGIFNSVFAESTDFLVDKFLQNKKFKNPYTPIEYDFTNLTRVTIPLQICERISTKDENTYENKIVRLKVRNDVYLKGQKLLAKDDIVEARVGFMIPNGMNGIPAMIYLTDFDSPALDFDKILSDYHKSGKSKIYWVLPLKWLLTPLPPTGSLTNFIKGGQATIKESDNIIIYYFPDWEVKNNL